MGGGAAVTEWCLKLDKAPPRRIAITPGSIAEARNALPPADTRALRFAAGGVVARTQRRLAPVHPHTGAHRQRLRQDARDTGQGTVAPPLAGVEGAGWKGGR